MSSSRTSSAAKQTRRFALPAVALLAAILAGCSNDAPVDPEKTATLIQPVARVELEVKKEEADSGPPNGEKIYNTVCAACHSVGVAGAPKTGNADDWAPRIAQGLDAMVTNAINGKGAMPARGGNPSLSDDAVRHAVVYLANTAGGKFSAE